jgi:hypothetical protein
VAAELPFVLAGREREIGEGRGVERGASPRRACVFRGREHRREHVADAGRARRRRRVTAGSHYAAEQPGEPARYGLI